MYYCFKIYLIVVVTMFVFVTVYRLYFILSFRQQLCQTLTKLDNENVYFAIQWYNKIQQRNATKLIKN